MTRLTKTMLAAALGLATVGGIAAESQACPRGGRSGGYSGGYRPGYSQPVQHYSYPTYQQSYPVQTIHPQFAQPSQLPAVIQKSAQVQRISASANVGGNATIIRSGAAANAQFATNAQVTVNRPVGNVTGSVPQGNGVPQGNRPIANPANGGAAPVNNAASTNGSSPAAAPSQTNGSAQLTALQVLAGLAAPEPQVSPSPAVQPTQPATVAPAQPAHVGQWLASLPNDVTVQLTLRADDTFTWTANANGKSSEFSGNYTIDGESLSLTRDTDGQRLAGSITMNPNGGFNFKLDGAKDNGLDFVSP
ncbi:MAG: hypothetical protein KDA71_08300 [Planctomycetales bacterium]|nr:hypothetical protein [Planctomycetales bacterium]